MGKCTVCVRGLVVWVSLFPFLHPVRVGKRERKKGGNGDVKNTMGIDVNYWLLLTFLTDINMVDCWEAFILW